MGYYFMWVWVVLIKNICGSTLLSAFAYLLQIQGWELPPPWSSAGGDSRRLWAGTALLGEPPSARGLSRQIHHRDCQGTTTATLRHRPDVGMLLLTSSSWS